MIKIGDTFRSGYADSNALWKVLKKKSTDVYLCEIVNETFEYEGKTFNGDYAGVQKVFLSREIEQSINRKNIFEEISEKCDSFYDALKVGDIVHYHDGFNKFVRCRVNENKELVPFSLVGEWRDYELPRRGVDGEIILSYYCKKIVNKEPFKPNATNIYEYPNFSRKNQDPNNFVEIDIKIPEQTKEEKHKSDIWVNLKQIQEEIQQGFVQSKDPETILNKVKNMVSKI